MTQNVLLQFNENAKRIKDLHSIYKVIKNSTSEIIDLSDILRAEIVLIVSALDCYIHNIVKVMMIDIFKGNRSKTSFFKNLRFLWKR